ncbi:hypothetical protein K502DRAFT_293809 [Neoconidiobolus thromboides FSU 785]|nr:hypothetical protein K502DRAFT_293809 [Neoconidiobolus thromboides FSU 785]
MDTPKKKKEEIEIFTLDQVQFELPDKLIHFSVANNQLVLLLRNKHFLIVDLLMADDILSIQLPNEAGTPHKIFIDVTGQHIFISTLDMKFFYYNKRLPKIQIIHKLNGYLVESIAFDKSINENSISTGYILVGCKDGNIFELVIEAKEESFKTQDKRIKNIYKFKEEVAICSIYYQAFPTDPYQYFVMVTSNDKLFQFIGKYKKGDKSRFLDIFYQYGENPQFQEVPGDIQHSETHYFSNNVEKEFHSLVSNFAWLTGAGIYYGDFIFGSQEKGGNLIENGQLIPYPNQEIPLSISLTEFHIILLYEEKIMAISKLNFEVVYKENIPSRFGIQQYAKQVIMDYVRRTFWIHTEDSIYEIIITDEDRNVWRHYLNKKMFNEGLKYAKTNEQKDAILFEQANRYFDTQRYHLSATYFGKCRASFDQIALKFIQKNELDALRSFLLIKLENINKSDITQTILLSTWITELYLVKMNEMEENSVDEINDEGGSSNQRILEEIEYIIREFHKYLNDNKAYLNKKVIYDLISNYGRTDQFIYFAEIMKDYDKVINHYILIHQFSMALQALSKQQSLELYYKYSVILMEHIPEDLVTLLMRTNKLDPIKLIPALLKFDSDKFKDIQNQSIRYLQFIISKLNCKTPSIHNLLLSLYVQQSEDNENTLLQFLMAEERYYNLDYALRLCFQYHRIQSIIFIYSLLGLYDEAVNTSLKYQDIELAKINADKVEDDSDRRKRLWLKIARYIIEEKKDISGAINLLQQNEVIKIEDILPYFPDFVQIDEFKEEICNALEQYNLDIQDIKHEMDMATKSAEKLRLDIKNQKSRFVLLSPKEKCIICLNNILTRQFYIFPCQHPFHSDCLIKKVSNNLSKSENQKLSQIQQLLTKEISGLKSVSEDLITEKRNHINKLKSDLDDIIAYDCPICGDLAVKNIDTPIISDNDFEESLSWML